MTSRRLQCGPTLSLSVVSIICQLFFSRKCYLSVAVAEGLAGLRDQVLSQPTVSSRRCGLAFTVERAGIWAIARGVNTAPGQDFEEHDLSPSGI
ncbi:hypothetical protein PoB_005728500 [Plakobranchus ocellatus]|uniref:Secreted protein n=1 Tax=Plakobranchus ocellatus TaxID=259542 RepID=A0AAV4CGX7_9GAST|nr:hypothetical protein PoB_005728500 [Plakobranchus ocellatus]